MKKSILSAITFLILFVSNAESKEKLSPLQVEASVTEISCHDAMDGKIELNIKGGKAPYIIVWDNGKSDLILDELRDGEYSVKVVDSKGAEQILEFKLVNPNEMVLDLNTHEQRFIDDLGYRVNMSIGGGTPYRIEGTDWYDITVEPSESSESSEYHVLKIVDSRGCGIQRNVGINFIEKQNFSKDVLNILVDSTEPLVTESNDICVFGSNSISATK